MRKKKHPEHVNHERWLVSYADFITLLFAFFVVMFAVSQVDSKKLGRFTEAFTKAVGVEMFSESGRGILTGDMSLNETEGGRRGGAARDLNELYQTLSTMASKPNGIAGLQVIRRRNELVLRLPESVLFDSGNDALKEATADSLRLIAEEIKARPVEVRVEGHTDSRPIHTVRFRSNWDLSTARATAVIVQLSAGGILNERLGAAGYGEFRPVASNDTDEGRKLNRRVDIVVTLLEGTGGQSQQDKAGETPGENTKAEVKGLEKPSSPQALAAIDVPKTSEKP